MLNRILGLVVLFFGAAGLGGCASQQYQYIPVEHARDVQENGRITYSVPPGKPEGKVTVSSMGVIDLEPSHASKQIPTIHLRMVISNQSAGQVWNFNTQDQVVSFPNDGEVLPTFVNSDLKSIPSLRINKGELRVLDLYFQLPANQKSAEDIPAFTLRWKIQTGEMVTQETALFNRIPVPPRPVVVYPYDPYPYAPGWGPVWWGGVGYSYNYR